jgi:hypothetical protein
VGKKIGEQIWEVYLLLHITLFHKPLRKNHFGLVTL